MIYFIHGPDTYRSKVKLNELIEQYSEKFELHKIEGEHIKLDELASKMNAVSIFTQKRLMVIEDLSKNKEQAELTSFLKERKSSDDEVIIFYEGKIKKNISLYKYLSRAGESFEFEEMSINEIKRWAENYVKERKGRIEKVALEELLMGANNDLWFLSRELDKLLAYKKVITLESVQLLTPANFDDNIFNLTDAIGRGDKSTALELINKQLDAGAAPIYLLAMIIRQFRILIQVKEASEKLSFPNNNFIAKEIGLHPFVVQKTMGQTKKYSFEELERIYANLQDLDLKLKSSKLSPESLLNLMVVK